VDIKELLNNVWTFGFGEVTVGKVITTILLALICILVVRVLVKGMDGFIKKKGANSAVAGFLRPLIKILLYFVALLVLADHVGIPVSSLLAVFSIAGLAASLAVQDTLSNFASGVLLLMTRPFKPGDFIECAGESGTVAKISLIYTQLNTADNRRVDLPNKDVAASKLVNYSENSTRRIDLTFTASYDCSVEDVKAALLEAVEMTEGVLEDPAVFIGVSDYKSSSIEYVVRPWCNGKDYWPVRGALIENVKKSFDKNGIIMTYDHLNVHIVEK